jgi:hypothetical protein
MSSACFRSVRTYTGPRRRIVSGLGLASVILLWAVSASAQTAGTSTSQICSQDPAYCSDTGATPSATTGGGVSTSASSGGSSGGGGSSGAGAGGPSPVPNTACGDGFPPDAWGGCN